jgi:Cof subfamily protein (haloacid dehalogenase superfamily)
MHRYKLVAFDMDETLLRPDSSLSDYAVEVLRAVAKSGVKIVPCTGRPYGGTLVHLRRIGLETTGVFCNGAQLRDTLSGEIFNERPVPLNDARLVIRLGEERGGHPRAYLNDRVYVSHVTEDDERYAKRTGSVFEVVENWDSLPEGDPVKLMTVMPTHEGVVELLEKSEKIFEGRLYVTLSLETFVEYTHIGATKGIGVQMLADRWGIAREEIVVAGDHLNDLTMFEKAGFSIAPQNAQPAVREAASCVCLSNAEDGVAKKFAEIFEI